MDARCRIELLGGLRIQQGDRVITRFRTRQTGALLAYLAYHLGRSLPREVVIEAIWSDVEARTGRNNLSIALNSLRSQLEPPGTNAGAVIQSDRFTVGLHPAAITTDVAEFLAALQAAEMAKEDTSREVVLRQAIDLYPGELLPGFYDEWTTWERHRLQALYEQTQEALNHLQAGVPISTALPSVAAPIRSAPQPQEQNTHLPLQFTNFFGREEELERLGRWCVENPEDPTHHFITLTGPGGTGKTRLAIKAAGRLAESFPGGVWFVPLQDLSDPRLIPGTVLDALRLPRFPQADPLHQVVSFLNSRSSATLLVLDNMEHLLDAERCKAEDGAAVVRALLDRCPSLTCLVTSRQRLDLEGEREFPILPLPTPSIEPRHPTQGSIPIQNPTLEHLMQFASVQLFVDRAQSSKPDFQVTQGNSTAIAQLCNRLEGIPLALVLAAGRAQVMTPKQMLSQLENRFDFLVSRKRDATERHRTLHSAIEWSYRLLSPELRRFFTKLSVFRGGWNVEAAAAVCEEPSALDYLAQLRECSLIRTMESDEEMRYTMLETIREFATNQLDAEQRSMVRQRHRDYFTAMSEKAEVGSLGGEQQAKWLRWFVVEHDNLRAALEESKRTPEGAEPGLRLVAALWGNWKDRYILTEGIPYLMEAVVREDAKMTTTARAFALRGVACLMETQGDYEAARALLQEGLAVARSVGEKQCIAELLLSLGDATVYLGDFETARTLFEEGRVYANKGSGADALNGLGTLAYYEGDYETARTLVAQSAAIKRELGERILLAYQLNLLGKIVMDMGDYEAAKRFLEEALEISVELGGKWTLSDALLGLACLAATQNAYGEARKLAEQSLTLFRESGERRQVALSLYLFANLELAEEKPERSARLSGVAEVLLKAAGLTLKSCVSPRDRERYSRNVAAAQEMLGKEAFASAWAEGCAMPMEQAIAYALDITGA